MEQGVFRLGQAVRLRERPEQRGRVVGHEAGGRSVRVSLQGAGGSASYDIDALVSDDSTELFRVVGREAFLARLARVKLRYGLADTLYAMGSARARFEVYQFKPAFKFLDGGCSAILIADEVGLGKTIEAGYIYLEMKARFPVQRTLVVCPSGLRTKWRDELRIRFDEEFTILDAAKLREFLVRYQQYELATPLRGICSLELLRSTEFHERFDELKVRFDLVIVDEAHHLRNPETLSHGIIELIRAHTDALVFLTATPVQLGATDLFTLLRLLDPGAFTSYDNFVETIRPNARINAVLTALAPPTDIGKAREHFSALSAPDLGNRFTSDPYFQRARDAIAAGPLSTMELLQLQQDVQRLNPLSHILTRTRKGEVQGIAMRSPQTLRVRLTVQEADFYQSVVNYVRAQASEREWGAACFALVTRERQVASCMAAAYGYFTELADDHSTILGQQGQDLSDQLLEEAPSDARDIGSLSSVLRAGAQLNGRDSKFDLFRDALRRALPESRDYKAVVFSFFKRTLAYLESRLRSEGYEVYRIDGDVKPEVRADEIAAFKRTRPHHGAVLLSSEVGAEGLDFQFCDTLVNYDLPWNPMRIEQRIGRLDRYGQVSPRIRIINFILERTIEERVLQRLYDRIDVFHQAIGDLEPILGRTVTDLVRELFQRDLSLEEEQMTATRFDHALARGKQDLLEFEKRHAELLGQDDAIMNELASARENGRTVSPDELRCLVQDIIARPSFGLVRLEHTARMPAGVWSLVNGRELVGAVTDYLSRERTGSEGLQELSRRVYNARDDRVWLTFDSAVAQDNPELPYLHLGHGLVRYSAANGSLQGRDDALSSIGRFVLRGGDLPCGVYLLCVYLFDEHGAQARRRLWTVAVRDGRADLDLGRLIFGKLASSDADTEASDASGLSSDSANAGIEIADTAASQERESARVEARRRNDAFLNQRLQAVVRTAEAQMTQASDRLMRAEDERIRRMYASRLRNLQQKLDEQRASFARDRGVTVSSELMCVAVVTVVEHSPSNENKLTETPVAPVVIPALARGQRVPIKLTPVP